MEYVQMANAFANLISVEKTAVNSNVQTNAVKEVNA
jgi:hypothetical protein